MRAAAALALALTGLAATPAAARPISHPRWLGGVLVTEYYPAPERWFGGSKVAAPGLRGRHRVDWLYSAWGVSMQGEGIGLDGRRYHIASLGRHGWVNVFGQPTYPTGNGGWTRGSPYWRRAGWRNASGGVTFPLPGGGWSWGPGMRFVGLDGITFAPGPSRPLRYWRSVAVDPRLIPLGSWVYIPAYRSTPGRGWFRAEDTGGAIIGRHLDVYRSPPAAPGGTALRNQRVYVRPARPGAWHPPRVRHRPRPQREIFVDV